MSQMVYIVIALTTIPVFFFLIGWNAKFFWPSLRWYHLPIFGLMIFGGIVVPLLYVVNIYTEPVLYISSGLLAASGAAVACYTRFRQRRTLLTWADAGIFAALVVIAVPMVMSTAQQAVPGGVDSAMHSTFMNFIETSGKLDVKYPLGLHILILFFEQALNISRAYVMQAMMIFLWINFFILTYTVVKKMTNLKVVAWLGVIAAVLDASFYNNLLNGSLTHIVAVNFILLYLYFLESFKTKESKTKSGLLIILSVAMVYMHFITWYLVLPAYWLYRAVLQRHSGYQAGTTICILLLSAPLIMRLYHFEGYAEVFLWSSAAIVAVEVCLFFLGKFLYRSLRRSWLQPVLGVISIILFAYYRNKIFFNIEEWYGWTVTALGLLGVGWISFRRLTHWLPYTLLFLAYTVLFSFFAWVPTLSEKLPIIKELLFYYGFTVPLVLFGASGLYFIVTHSIAKRQQALKLSIVTIIALLIFISRLSNTVYIDGGNAISRYNSNTGFGIFYTRQDVALASWMRNHIHDNTVVANVGGFYGLWTSATAHPLVYLGYGQMNIPQPAEVNTQIIDLMTNAESGRPDLLLSYNVRYLFIPEEVPAEITHPYLRLVHSQGKAKLYQILDQPMTQDRVVTLSSLLVQASPGITLSGDFTTRSALHGNRFFFQFQEAVQYISLGSDKTLRIKILPATQERRISFLIQAPANSLQVTSAGISTVQVTQSSNQLEATMVVPTGQGAELVINNTQEESVTITSLVTTIR